MLWPSYWDGTIASHPRESETYVSSAERRMPEEIGIDCKMNYMNKFEYHVPYKDIGSENEICGTLIGIVDDFDETCLIKDEISEIKWIDPDELKNELQQNMDVYCPWMVIALYFLDRSSYPNGDKFHSLIKNWTKNDSIYKNAIKHYIPNNNWRRVPDG
jgi:isopentenyl-diphosphate delta-isomerase